jgi:hypothetical protein
MLEKYNKANLNPIGTPDEPGIKLAKNKNQATCGEAGVTSGLRWLRNRVDCKIEAKEL